ncbi:putative adenylyl-sulfate kinase [Massilia sp. Bi118]|uniref:adenylyl-sulfate kinase n=1 Tax=Massilia sp. Bi118 TaxID=2822346 RepID=UPI001D9039D7|nr:adenylyl-sulfate kinase [Massilia sp. Bi118]CAH0240500.1 putative adenylyl-sulfate kinase [Massilia sp. Bi118]
MTATQPVSNEERLRRAGHRGAVVWITGLSGAGKTTLALAAERALFERGCRVFVLDGDKVRNGLCADLGFSLPERSENIRRIGEVARLFYEAGQIVLVSAISPLQADRERARALIPSPYFLEVYCRCPLAVCEQRDPKGLYRKARAGLLPEFTGISSPYEEPSSPELIVDSTTSSVDEEVARLLDALERKQILSALA